MSGAGRVRINFLGQPLVIIVGVYLQAILLLAPPFYFCAVTAFTPTNVFMITPRSLTVGRRTYPQSALGHHHNQVPRSCSSDPNGHKSCRRTGLGKLGGGGAMNYHHFDSVSTKRPTTLLLGVPSSGSASNDNLGQRFSNLKINGLALNLKQRVKSMFSGSQRRTVKQVRSAFLFVVLDVLFRRLFQYFQITSFPSSLGGCAALFTTLLLLPKSMGESIHNKYLQPGATLLAQWLPVMFVPSLITLPLADAGLGSTLEFTKVGIVVVGGLLLSLWTTATSVISIRHYSSNQKSVSDAVNDSTSSVSRFIASADGQVVEDNPIQAMSVRAIQYAETQKGRGSTAFSRSLLNKLASLSLFTGVSSVALHYIQLGGASSPFATWLPTIHATMTSLSLLCATLTTFVFGSRLPSRTTKRIHPLVTCSTLTWMTAFGFSRAFGKSFATILKRYYRGTGHSSLYGGTLLPAGDVLLSLLGPAVVSLASSMYQRRQLLRDNWKEVMTSVSVSTLTGLFGTALAVRVLQLANPYLRLSLLSRNITSPLAMAMASVLGADVSLAVTMVVITGLLGANFGTTLLDWWHIRDPVARGLAMGSAAHGLGTAALASSNEPDAFPFAALAMALTASAAVSLVSIPVVRQILVQLALGG